MGQETEKKLTALKIALTSDELQSLLSYCKDLSFLEERNANLLTLGALKSSLCEKLRKETMSIIETKTLFKSVYNELSAGGQILLLPICGEKKEFADISLLIAGANFADFGWHRTNEFLKAIFKDEPENLGGTTQQIVETLLAGQSVIFRAGFAAPKAV